MKKIIIALLVCGAALALMPTMAFAADKTLKVALILDQRRGDQGVIDRAVAGVQKAASEIPGSRCRSSRRTMHPSTPTPSAQWRGNGVQTSSSPSSRVL